MMKLSIVIPVFNSCKILPELVTRIQQVPVEEYELILVDDGNGPETWRTITALANSNVKGIRLGRNFGQHAALLAGVREARFPIIATLDDDLQNPPEELINLLRLLTDDIDVVYGVPKYIQQSAWRSFASTAAKLFMKRTIGFTHAVDISSFRVFKTRLRDDFALNLGPGVSIDALLSWSTDRFAMVKVDHNARKSGKSNYNLRKLLNFMIDTVTGYSTIPLRVATWLGMLTSGFSLVVLCWVLGRPFVTGESVSGFPFLATTIAIFSGVQLTVIGVIGQYIGRMHFRVMNKPTYSIAERTKS